MFKAHDLFIFVIDLNKAFRHAVIVSLLNINFMQLLPRGRKYKILLAFTDMNIKKEFRVRLMENVKELALPKFDFFDFVGPVQLIQGHIENRGAVFAQDR